MIMSVYWPVLYLALWCITSVKLEECSYVEIIGDMYCENKNISFLTKEDYPLNVTYIRKLNVAFCSIKSVSFDAFEKHGNLSDLKMNDNSIESLDYRIFSKTIWLQKLYLNSNRIKNFDTRLFMSLDRLIFLDISHNPLKSDLDPALFASQRLLIHLKANSMGLKFVPVDVIEPLHSLQNLEISDNDIKCSCKLKNVTRWAEEKCLKFSMNCLSRGGSRSNSIEAYRSDFCRKKGSVTTPLPIHFPWSYKPRKNPHRNWDDEYGNDRWGHYRPGSSGRRPWDEEYFDRGHRYPVYIPRPPSRDYEYEDENDTDTSESTRSPIVCNKRQCIFTEKLSLMDCEYIPLYSFKANEYPFPERGFKELRLDNNELTELQGDAFDPLQELLSLSLRYNKLSSLNAAVFRKLKSLRFLDLSDNKLDSIFEGTLFRSQKNLQLLYMNNNRFGTFDGGLFRPTKNLKRLFLKGNPLYCECALRYAVRLLIKRKVHTETTCASPPLYVGKSWNVLEDASYCTYASEYKTLSFNPLNTLIFVGCMLLLVLFVLFVFKLCALFYKYFPPADINDLPEDYEF